VRLPIDSLLPTVLEHLRASRNLVLEAPPGAGKTTRVPPALLELSPGEVLVLEPRRIAARMAARFVAGERGEAVGETVGYHVRFEEAAGPRTRLRFLTEGVLTRRLLRDPALSCVAAVVFDEFHERHLEGDLALALLRRLQRGGRPDLRLVVMSATLDAAPVTAYLGDAAAMRCPGRQYPLEIEYTPHSSAPLEAQVAAAVERLPGGQTGHTLVFLPGAAEIRHAQAACSPFANRQGWQVLPLYGDQTAAEQDRAVAPSAQRKIILATNVAESSITIEGVTAVVDSGLARVASHSPWSGLPALQVARISQASADQRAGRAGRTGPGRVVRLYPLEDFARRPAQETPEIVRADLAPAALLLDALGTGFGDLDWLDAAPPAAVEQARDLLDQLGARGALGREMARYPLHPRLARLIVEAGRRGVAEDGCTVAALLSAGERLPTHPEHATRSDLLALAESRWTPQTAQVVRQVRRIVNPPRQRTNSSERQAAGEDALLISVLAAFPDRVARRRQGRELLLAAGGAALLAESSTVTGAAFLVAVEAEDRRDQELPLVRLASAIEPEWLLDLFPERVREISRVEWNRAAERVEQLNALMFREIAIQENRGAPDPEPAAALLAEKALEAGAARFADGQELAAWEERRKFASAHGQAGALPQVEDALRELCVGLRSFAELEAAAHDGGLLRALERRMPAAARRLLDEIAPERIRLPGGRQVRVHYEPGQPPWVASRLQDFFGMRQTPTVARGAVPLVVRLLAPSQRPVQTTSDLAGFWQRLYPQVRKELARRYPKHKWPENPLLNQD
jgi:ATP-dependent helicase HrpB